MGRKYAIRDQQAVYFVTFTVLNWIDLFIRDEYKEIFLQSLIFCQDKKGLNVHAYCIMTSHVHLILSAKEGYNLSDIIRDIKSYTSTAFKKCIKENNHESRKEYLPAKAGLIWFFERARKKNKRNRGFQLWQQHNHPIELSTNEMKDQRLDYIHNNPVKAGFVDEPTTWLWSSSASYEKEKEIDSKIELVYL